MPSNAEAAEQLRAIADLLDLLGERFKPEAYRRAARSLEGLGEELALLERRGALDTVPGVGEAIAEKLREYLRLGMIPYLERLRTEVPPGIVELLRYEGIGPKTTRRFWTELGIEDPAQLRAALASGRLDGVKGFGPTKIAQLKATLDAAAPSGVRTPLWEASEVARRLVEGLRASAPLDRIEPAGSLRRGRETVGDLDLLVTSPRPPEVFEAFTRLPEVASVRLRGDTKETVLLRSGLQVDLRVVPPASFGAALQYFTGSKDHNVRLRSRAQKLGLKVNEYGVFRDETVVAGGDEAGVYRALGLPEIPPELREDHGEIEAAEQGKLPVLVTGADLRGDLHLHPDPARPLPAGARATWERARDLGHRYVGLLVPEATPPELLEELHRLGGDGPRTYLGVELPIDRPPDRLPEGIDYWLATPPAGGSGPPAGTGRLPGAGPWAVVHLATSRDGSAEGDPGRAAPWIAWAADHAVALELSCLGSRAGLDSASARAAHGRGVRLLVSGGGAPGPDAPRLGVALALARRAGLGPKAVLNAAPVPGEPTAPPRAPRPRRRPATRAPAGSGAPPNG